MADHDGPARPAAQQVGDGGPSIDVQMIGRFVQNQKVRLTEKQAGKTNPRLLPAAQRHGGPFRFELRQSDVGQSRGDTIIQRPVSELEVVARGLARQHSRDDRQRPGDAQQIRDGIARPGIPPLFQPGDVARARDSALGGIGLPDDQAKQGRLAGAVSADNTRPLTPEGEAQIREKGVTVRRAGRDAIERHDCGCGRVSAWERGHERARAAAERKGRNRFPAC